MRPLQANEIKGNWATILLPINKDDSIDFSRLAAEVDYLTAAGVDGVYTNGTTGEFYAQTEEEFDSIQMLVAEKCEKGGLPFQIGASHMDVKIMLSRVGRAAELEPAAIQVILPDWFPLNSAEQLSFLEKAAQIADPIGLVLYNPPHAKRVLSPVELGELANSETGLVGLKVLDGNEGWYEAMRTYCSRLSIFVPGHHLATGINNGASGSYSNVACLSPIGGQWWYELMHTNLNAALEFEKRLQNFFSRYVTPYIEREGYSNQAVDKLLAASGDWVDIGTRLRWPYRSIPSVEVERLHPLVRTHLPELFPPF